MKRVETWFKGAHDYVVIRFPWLGTKMTTRQILAILVASFVVSAILTAAQLLFAGK